MIKKESAGKRKFMSENKSFEGFMGLCAKNSFEHPFDHFNLLARWDKLYNKPK